MGKTRAAVNAFRKVEAGWTWALDHSTGEAVKAPSVSTEQDRIDLNQTLTELVQLGTEYRRNTA